MKVSQSQLEQYLSKAAWILKGPVDASDFKSYIFPLLFFKRISDVYDEEYELALKESGNDKEYASGWYDRVSSIKEKQSESEKQNLETVTIPYGLIVSIIDHKS